MIKRIVIVSCMASCMVAMQNPYQPYGIPVYPQQGQVIVVPQQERPRSFVRGVTKFAVGAGCLFGAYLCAQKAQTEWRRMSSMPTKATNLWNQVVSFFDEDINGKKTTRVEDVLAEAYEAAKPYGKPVGWGGGSAVLCFTGLKCIVSAVRNDL